MIGLWEEPEFPMLTLLNCETVEHLGLSFPQSKLINKYTIEIRFNYESIISQSNHPEQLGDVGGH
jgi:hypothetical protein